MAKQKIQLEIDVPSEYGEVEPTGEIRCAMEGELHLRMGGECGIVAARGPSASRTAILRRIEPTQVRLARDLKKFWTGSDGTVIGEAPKRWVVLSEQLIADWEASK